MPRIQSRMTVERLFFMAAMIGLAALTCGCGDKASVGDDDDDTTTFTTGTDERPFDGPECSTAENFFVLINSCEDAHEGWIYSIEYDEATCRDFPAFINCICHCYPNCEFSLLCSVNCVNNFCYSRN